MRNNKVIDPSLNKKIAENERRIKNLFNAEFTLSKSKNNIRAPSQSQRNMKSIHHKKNKSQDEIFKTIYNIDNKEISLFKGTIDNTFPKTLQIGDDGETAFINRMEKRMKQRRKSSQKEEEKNDKIFYSTVNNVYQKMKERKNKKVYNRDQVDNIVDRLYNNDHKNKKQPNKVNKVNKVYKKTKEIEKDNSAIDLSLKTESMETINKKLNEPNNVNVDNMIERFEEDMKKRNEKMERKRKELKKNEKKIYTYKPKINESKKVEYTGKDDFLERQKKYDEQKKKREERYKEELKIEEEKKINENNFLLQKNNRKERRERKEKKEKIVKKEEKKNEQIKPENKKKKEEVEKMIKHFYDWENKRKEKIASKKKEETGKVENEFDHMPKINKRSNSLANKKNKKKDEPDVFTRLSKEDKMLKEKRQVLIDLCTPSFVPNCFLHNQKIKRKNKESPNKSARKKVYSYNESSLSEAEEGEEGSEGSSDESYVKEDGFDYKQDPNFFTEDDLHDALRKALLDKVKK